MSDETSLAVARAYDLVEAGRFAEARAILDPILLADRDNADAWWVYSYAVSTPEEARDALANVLRIDPDYPGARELWQTLNQNYPAEEPVAVSSPPPPPPADVDPLPESIGEPEFDYPLPPPRTPSVEATLPPAPEARPRRSLVPFLALAAVILLVLAAILLFQPQPQPEATQVAIASTQTTVGEAAATIEVTADETADDAFVETATAIIDSATQTAGSDGSPLTEEAVTEVSEAGVLGGDTTPTALVLPALETTGTPDVQPVGQITQEAALTDAAETIEAQTLITDEATDIILTIEVLPTEDTLEGTDESTDEGTAVAQALDVTDEVTEIAADATPTRETFSAETPTLEETIEVAATIDEDEAETPDVTPEVTEADSTEATDAAADATPEATRGVPTVRPTRTATPTEVNEQTPEVTDIILTVEQLATEEETVEAEATDIVLTVETLPTDDETPEADATDIILTVEQLATEEETVEAEATDIVLTVETLPTDDETPEADATDIVLTVEALPTEEVTDIILTVEVLPTATSTATEAPTETATPTVLPTETVTPTRTETETPTETNTATPTRTQTAASQPPTATQTNELQIVVEALDEFDIPEGGAFITDTLLGDTVVVQFCTEPGPALRELLPQALYSLSVLTDVLTQEIDAIAVQMINCEDDNAVLLSIGAPVTDARNYARGVTNAPQFQATWRALQIP